jgi:hypothetical protein
VAAIIMEAQTAWDEWRARESTVLLPSTHGKADEVAQKVTLLEGELVVLR